MRIFMQPQEDDFDKAVERFLSHCKSKNLSAETISTYRNKLKQFGIFLDSNDISLSDINAETIESYITWLHDNRNCNDITVNSYLRQIKAFLYWAMEYSLITPFKVHLIKADKPETAFIDENGNIEARSVGKGKFTAKVNGKTITISVKVK